MIRTAIIGVGVMGSQYAQMIGDGLVSGMELAAVTRIKGYFRERLQKSLAKGLPVYESADLLFQAVEDGSLQLDAVIIATPHYSHEEIARRAFSLGLHVMSDKPAGVYVRQARNMAEAAEEYGQVFAMMFNQRTLPIYSRVRELVQSGRYGALKRVSWTVTDWYRTQSYYQMSPWRATWAGEGGGLLINQCPHNLDLLCWICGIPSAVLGICHEGRFHDIEVEDDVTAYLEWENGATGTFVSSTGDAFGENRLEITMDEAMIVCEKGKLMIRELGDELGMPEEEFRRTTKNMFCRIQGSYHEEEPGREEQPYIRMLENFAAVCSDNSNREENAVYGKSDTAVSLIAEGADGINSLLLSNAIYLSSWEGRRIVIPKQGSPEMEEFEKAFEGWLARKIENSRDVCK